MFGLKEFPNETRNLLESVKKDEITAMNGIGYPHSTKMQWRLVGSTKRSCLVDLFTSFEFVRFDLLNKLFRWANNASMYSYANFVCLLKSAPHAGQGTT